MSFCEAAKLIASSNNILLVTHRRPDGDAIGSIVALRQMIIQQAKHTKRSCQVETVLLNECPASYRFIMPYEPWLFGKQLTQADVDANELDRFDLIIILDTCALGQLGGLGQYLLHRDRGVLVIDHHVSRDDIGCCKVVNTTASATGEILYEGFREAEWELDNVAAAALYVATSTDTGWFRFENASANVYRIAGELVDRGVRPDIIYRELFQSFPAERIRLLTLALNTVEFHCDGRLAVMQITDKMLTESGADRSLIENMVNECYQVGSVIVSILLVEKDDATRVSFRSRGDDNIVDVNAIAKQFGGGGHIRAAGTTLEMPIKQGYQKVLAAIKNALKC